MHKLIVTDEIMGSSPFNFGEFDARKEEPCEPEAFYSSNDCIVHYVLGYESIAGKSEATQALLQKYDSPEISKNWVDCEWEYRFNDFTSPERPWHPTFEQRIREYLNTSHSHAAIEADLAAMRADHTLIIRNHVVDVRCVAEEPDRAE